MKLNKEQRQVVALNIYRKVNEAYEEKRQKELDKVTPEITAFCSKFANEWFKVSTKHIDIKPNRFSVKCPIVVCDKELYFSDDYIRDYEHLKESLTREVKSFINKEIKTPLQSAIEEDLILQSIEATDLTTLMENLIEKYK